GLAPTPIIALTASVMARDRHEARQAGMSGFAVKPLDVPKLYEEILRVLEGRPDGASDIAAPQCRAVRVIDWDRGVTLWGDQARLASRILAFLEDAPAAYPLSDPGPDSDPGMLLFSLHGLRGAAGN